jgi:hypothetical protein
MPTITAVQQWHKHQRWLERQDLHETDNAPDYDDGETHPIATTVGRVVRRVGAVTPAARSSLFPPN